MAINVKAGDVDGVITPALTTTQKGGFRTSVGLGKEDSPVFNDLVLGTEGDPLVGAGHSIVKQDLDPRQRYGIISRMVSRGSSYDDDHAALTLGINFNADTNGAVYTPASAVIFQMEHEFDSATDSGYGASTHMLRPAVVADGEVYCSVSSGSTTVTGLNSDFQTDLRKGDTIVVGGTFASGMYVSGGVVRTVASIESATSLTVTSAFPGNQTTVRCAVGYFALAGTVTATAGSISVTGIGTDFGSIFGGDAGFPHTFAPDARPRIVIPAVGGGYESHRIASVESDIALTLAYPHSLGSGGAVTAGTGGLLQNEHWFESNGIRAFGISSMAQYPEDQTIDLKGRLSVFADARSTVSFPQGGKLVRFMSQVADSTASNWPLVISYENLSTTGTGQIHQEFLSLGDGTHPSRFLIMQNGYGAAQSSWDRHSLLFYAYNSLGSSGGDIMYLDGRNGRVGINNHAPTTTLDVTGTVTATAFAGDGSALTGLDAGDISAGTLTVGRGGTGVSTSGTTSQIAVGGGTGSAIVWTTASGSGAPLRQTLPTITTPIIATIRGVNNTTVVNLTDVASGDSYLEITNAIQNGNVAINAVSGTGSNAGITFGIAGSGTVTFSGGSIDLGSSDTTLGRLGAGRLGVEGVEVLTQTNTLTGITNKTFTAPALMAPVIGDGTGATAILASNLSGATDPTITFGNALTTVSSNLTLTAAALTFGVAFTSTIQATGGNDLYLDVASTKRIWMSFNGTGVVPAAFTGQTGATNYRLELAPETVIAYSATSNSPSGTKDTGLSRIAAGVLGVGTGAAASRAGWQQWAGQSYIDANATCTDATMITTGLSVTLTAARKYSFKAVLYVANSTAGDGVKVDLDGGAATATNIRAHAKIFDTALLLSTQVSALATDIAVATVTGDAEIVIEGSITVNAGGTFIIRFAENSDGGGTLTLYRGSHLLVWDMP